MPAGLVPGEPLPVGIDGVMWVREDGTVAFAAAVRPVAVLAALSLAVAAVTRQLHLEDALTAALAQLMPDEGTRT
jgi:hypothetical protein